MARLQERHPLSQQRARRLRQSVIADLLAAAGWLALIAIATVVVPTWLGRTLHPVHAAVLLVLPYLAVPASLVVLLAVVLRRLPLTVAGVALTCALLVPVAVVALTGPAAVAAAGRPTLTLYVANLRYDNVTADDAARQAVESGADVLVLIELTPAYVDRLRAAGVDERYPHQMLDPQEHPYGSGIYSRLPLHEASLRSLASHVEPQVTVDVGGQLVDVMSVHASAPAAPVSLAWWKDELSVLDDESARLARPTIWAGDFNADRWHPELASLLDGPFVHAHDAAGRALTPSWPVSGRLGRFGGWARLDHALVHDLDVVDVVDLPARGSDHRPFVLTVAVG